MALKTLGSNANNSLSAFVQNNATLFTAADMATMRANIKNDQINGQPIWPNGFDDGFNNYGRLYIPNRGVLIVFPGDYVGYDSTGWPILVSAKAIASGPWTHS